MNIKLLRITFWAGLLSCSAIMPAAHGASVQVQMGNWSFSPAKVTINPGDMVVWTNSSTMPHDSTSFSNVWASGNLTNGSRSFAFTFPSVGVFPYHCTRHQLLHPEQTGTVSVVSQNLSPTAAITNPPPGKVFAAHADILIQASAKDTDGSVTNLQIRIDAATLATFTSPPFDFTLSNAIPGSYLLQVIATDNQGAKGTSAPVSITVVEPAPLQLLSPLLSAGQFRFDFTTTTGLRYAVETADELPGGFNVVSNLTATGDTTTFVDPQPATASRRFFRVSLQP